jgi:hypothetical protein
MKERPIIFNGPMVRAILSGIKTQTRRVVKLQPTGEWKIDTPPVLGRITSKHHLKERFGVFVRLDIETCFPLASLIPCPYGQPGDRLWVRETWKPVPISAYRCSEGVQQTPNPQDADEAAVYKAGWDRSGGGVSWRSPIHMPRWASRITLEITDVRVERLQDISEADAIAEGVRGYPFRPEDGWPICTGYMVGDDDGKTTLHPKPQDPYRLLWESINGPGSWDTDPWVWVIQFKRI